MVILFLHAHSVSMKMPVAPQSSSMLSDMGAPMSVPWISTSTSRELALGILAMIYLVGKRFSHLVQGASGGSRAVAGVVGGFRMSVSQSEASVLSSVSTDNVEYQL
jgi:hypothetical protein